MTVRVERREIPFNPAILKWARERLRLAYEDAARRTAVTPERIAQWEQGSAKPTVRQARQLASLYNRPFLEFFSPTIPELEPLRLAPDFRFHRRAPSDAELTILEGVQEWAEAQRLNAIDLYESLGEAPPRLPRGLHSNKDEKPEAAADRARLILDFPVDVQLRLRSNDRRLLPAMLRKTIESVGILVLKQSGLTKARVRGICLYDEVLPVIVFGNEAPGGQAFTLAHELAHVILGQSAVSGVPRLGHLRGSEWKRIEGWCNEFAAAFLMPAAAVRAHGAAPRTLVDEISDQHLTTLANNFAVSRHAMLIRLVSLGLVNAWYYWRVKRPQFLQEEANYVGGGRPEYYGSRFRSALGDRYTGLVLEALETGRIGYHSAAEFMGIKNVRHLEDIRDHFGRQGA